ncbi:hypothetical protein CKO28_06040 [Rhodovibrio sodomensis]|uniref:DUF218 domain-containing protein n=1 Tax=Rhodovibrio sodomensis TaxID=1088 RepID=A0ABS1DBT0_9PROT|nr:ElyC/SanA/YdcF family protein [Rhodovibrio sodomensis]MBK1667592.1 hypothetical protein [Rhodovibrio sodomensis]
MRNGPGILVHGYHLHAPGWATVMWGEPPYRMGRLPRAILAASQLGVRTMVVGSGASAADGYSEAAWAIDLLWSRWGLLADFQALADADLTGLRAHLVDRVILDEQATKTREEIARAATTFNGMACHGMTLVTSPFHAPRALRDAASHLAATGLTGLSNALYVAVADTNPPATLTREVAIAEPPHRPDRPSTGLAAQMTRLQALPPAQQMAAADRLAAWLDGLSEAEMSGHDDERVAEAGAPVI